ncbi:hypothetical protein AGMMS50239_22450 [Bacteroidia bacterium]|nr:hypothetical protein AGMMS50239_22450 [Bacteroidia bacterium]
MNYKTLHKTILLLATIIIFAGCMEDGINNPQGTGKEITVKFEAPSRTFYYEDGVNLSPVIAYANESDSALNVFTYEWILKSSNFATDSIISTDRTLDLPTENLKLGKQQLLLVVTDERYGSKYSAQIQIEVILRSSVGIFVLSKEVSGASSLSVLTVDEKGTFSSRPLDFGGIGSDPVGLVYHRMRESAELRQVGYLQVTQRGGPGTIDLRLLTMSQEPQSSLNEQFGGTAPALTKSTYYGDHFALTLTQDGDLYKKTETVVSKFKVPYAGKYLPTPIIINGGARITHWANTSTMNENSGVYTLLMYDALNARFLSVTNNAVSYPVTRTGEINPLNNYALSETGSANASKGAPDLKGYKPGDESPTGLLTFPKLDDLSDYEMIGFTLYYLDLHNTYFYDVMSIKAAAILKKKSNGKFYLLTFAQEGNYNKKSMSASLLDFVELEQPDGAGSLGNNILLCGWCDPMFGSYPYVFFTNAERNKVYRYDCDRHQRRLVYTSNSPITVLYLPEPGATTKTANPNAHPYFNKLLIGAQNGDVVCMGMPVVATDEFVELHTYRTGKEIVDFAFVPNEAAASSNLAK